MSAIVEAIGGVVEGVAGPIGEVFSGAMDSFGKFSGLDAGSPMALLTLASLASGFPVAGGDGMFAGAEGFLNPEQFNLVEQLGTTASNPWANTFTMPAASAGAEFTGGMMPAATAGAELTGGMMPSALTSPNFTGGMLPDASFVPTAAGSAAAGSVIGADINAGAMLEPSAMLAQSASIPTPFGLPEGGQLDFAQNLGAAAGPNGTGFIPGGGGGWNWEEIWKRLKGNQSGPMTAFNIGTGIYGLMQAQQLAKMARMASEKADPFAAQRPQYQAQLSALMADPSSITKTPGFDAGRLAVERKMAAQGYLGSGNMMRALQDYGGNFYDQQVTRLAQLAGAQFGPGYAGTTMMSGESGAAALRGNALNRLGYGLSRAGV